MNNLEKGKAGEKTAKEHYLTLGYELMEENYRFRRAEVDLIFLEEEKTLVFVEVKKRGSKAFGEAEKFVSDSQISRIKEAAENYILRINWQKEIRFDIVSVDNENQVEVFEDAF